MGGNRGIGKEGLALAGASALAMCIISYVLKPVEIMHIQYGLCLSSPDSWQISPFISWLINTFLIGVIAFLLNLINRIYNFIKTTEPTLIAIFLLMASSSAWFTQGVNTSTLLCLVNVICLGIIFSVYDARNATQQMFVLGIAIGLGTMFQYAFLPMALVYLLWALFMKVMRIKEILAFLAGIFCPYWISLGFGWICWDDFHFPSLVSFFSETNDHTDIFLLLIGIGIAVLLGIFTTLPNSIKLYAGNSLINAMNLCVVSLGIASFICILIDYKNLLAYVMTLYLTTSIQLANFCTIWKIKNEWCVTVIPGLLFIGLFIGNILL